VFSSWESGSGENQASGESGIGKFGGERAKTPFVEFHINSTNSVIFGKYSYKDKPTQPVSDTNGGTGTRSSI
jgi:hypothetical protein